MKKQTQHIDRVDKRRKKRRCEIEKYNQEDFTKRS